MAFSDHKIAAFTHKITDLPDQPNLPADELKARFDSSPEELRQAHNALCDDADRLDNRVSGIIAETFGDTISKSMLSDELQDEIDAKATQTDLAAVSDDVTAEATARESADSALDTRVDALEDAMPEKCEIEVGYYRGNGSLPRTFNLGYHPRAVFITITSGPVATMDYSYSLYLIEQQSNDFYEITDTGYILRDGAKSRLNESGRNYFYMIIR